MTHRFLAAAAVAIALALAGCAGIPSSGPVESGDVIDNNVDVPIGFLPSGPRAGSTVDDILQDFMTAATNPQDNYETARQFLASSVRETWNPDEIVSIRSGAFKVDTLSETSRRYTFDQSAEINNTGRYTEEAEATKKELQFEFVQEDGEWRIGSLLDGIVLRDDNFDSVFAARPLYFFDPSYTYLVPDTRWFPVTSRITTRITTALIAGPSTWLGNAVVTAFPLGTTLDDVVAVDSGTATVDLASEAQEATPAERNRMVQQLKASLTNVSTVSSVTLAVGGIPLPVEESSAPQAITQPSVNSLPLVRQGDSLGFATSSDLTILSAASAAITQLSATGGAYAIGRNTLALRSDAGVYAAVSGAEPLLLEAGDDFVDPSIDEFGYVWTAKKGDVASITAWQANGAPVPIDVSSLPVGARVVSLDVSRDGTRLLLSLTTDEGAVLGIAGINRQEGKPQLLGEFTVLSTSDATPLDAAWVNDRSVVSLTAAGTFARVITYDIGGPSTDIGMVEGGVSITAVGSGGTAFLRVLSSDGTVWKPRSTTWQDTGIDASFLATQQPG